MKRRTFTPSDDPPPPPGYVEVPLPNGCVGWVPESGPSPERLRRVAELHLASLERRKQREKDAA